VTTSRAHILVRLDANHHIGMGHAIRVSAILDLLKTPHSTTVAGDLGLISDLFSAKRTNIVPVKDTEAFFALISTTQPDLILVDHPRLGPNFWRRLSKYNSCAASIVALDDEGGDVEAELIVNSTILDQYHRYPLLRPQATLLCGAKYALIRPVFAETKWQNSSGSSVVIVVGSGDRARDWALHLMSGKVELNNWGKVRMIVGRAFPDMDRLWRSCDSLGVSLESGISAEAMAQALSQARVALITGGMIVFEALAVGVPTVVYPQMENMIPEAKWFAERGCLVDLGHEGGMNCGLVEETVGLLLSSSSKCLTMSLAQRAIIDGRGMVRAAKAISDLLCSSSKSEF
jgi:spore coat polysaccharide biosynthesis predicted glycosyltransferase SpsG